MNPILAASPFENPWVLAILLILGAVINWLSQRRQQRQEEEAVEETELPSPAEKTPPDLNVEEMLRRLMGEEPAPPHVPPPIPRAAENATSPAPVRRQEPAISSVPAGSTSRPPIIPTLQGNIATTSALSEYQKHSARRGEQAARHPTPMTGGTRRARSGRGSGARWRNRQSARQAFVASVVFAPPKGLEP